MKKLPYITILTALALLFRLHAVYSYNPSLLLFWAAGLAVLLAGELIGIRVGKDFGYASNIGAAVSSALMLAVSVIWLILVMQVYPADYLGTMWNSIYDMIGFTALGSLLINLGSVAAKRVLIWREHHGALPHAKLTLRAFLPHFIVTGVLNVLLPAVFYVTFIFFPDAVLSGVISIPLSALKIAIFAETANMIGIFFNRLLEKRVINNILIAATGIVRIIVNINFLSKATDHANPDYVHFSEGDIISARFFIAAWAAVIVAAGVWAVIKRRKLPKSPLPDDR